jgi:hypothetical protein
LSDEKKQSREDLIFLFGAGASVDAGVPDTLNFVRAFKDYITETYPDVAELLSKILTLREEYNIKTFGEEEKAVDVEQLLDTLRRLIAREKEPLLYFYNKSKPKIKIRKNQLEYLEKLLQNFIRRKVVVENQEKLGYLQELLSFDLPLSIFSTNYDTCVEQICYLNHMSYTDGFDVTWNEENFEDYHDVYHFKLHGSVIWYENKRTKESVKIPVSAFVELFEDPIDLRLIYGEDVKPLIIYPAQKSDYVEPLTDLQLMFKKTLFQKAKFLVVVGYSFRDEYIKHMLWDASRANPDLNVIIVDPNAQEHYEKKLRYIDRNLRATSRLANRIFCIPYPFSTVIYDLKNNYLRGLQEIMATEKGYLKNERAGDASDWNSLYIKCLEGEFVAKAEYILDKKIRTNWDKVRFNQFQTRHHLSFRSLLHSVICQDGFEERWLKRLNDAISFLDVNNLSVNGVSEPVRLIFPSGQERHELNRVIKEWINPLLDELDKKEKLLTPKFEWKLNRLKTSLTKLRELSNYLNQLEKGILPFQYQVTSNDSTEVQTFIGNILNMLNDRYIRNNELEKWIVGIERSRLRNLLGADRFQFSLEPI